MNLDELRSVQVEERKTDSLQPLRDSFYAGVADFLAGLREERERAAAEAADPFAASDVREINDEIETAEEVVEAIYERRVGKVVKRASLAAAGIPTDEGGLTDEEVELFEALVDDIERNRRQVLAVLASEDDAPATAGQEGGAPSTPDGPSADPDTSAPEPPPDEPVFDAGRAVGDENDAAGGSSGKATHPGADDDMTASDSAATTDPPGTTADPSDHPSDSQSAETGAAGEETSPERVSVRITRDVGEILGIDDRTYTLAEDDVVTLPVANAEPLLDRDAAERIE